MALTPNELKDLAEREVRKYGVKGEIEYTPSHGLLSDPSFSSSALGLRVVSNPKFEGDMHTYVKIGVDYNPDLERKPVTELDLREVLAGTKPTGVIRLGWADKKYFSVVFDLDEEVVSAVNRHNPSKSEEADSLMDLPLEEGVAKTFEIVARNIYNWREERYPYR